MADSKPKVFVVDDDVSVRESLELVINNEGWQPETFASAQEFLDRPRALVPSCLLLDSGSRYADRMPARTIRGYGERSRL
jgi:FixJ family two-component response regulator